MTDPAKLLRRQQDWQTRRARLTWGEKVSLVERVREDIVTWVRPRRKSRTEEDSTAGGV